MKFPVDVKVNYSIRRGYPIRYVYFLWALLWVGLN